MTRQNNINIINDLWNAYTGISAAYFNTTEGEGGNITDIFGPIRNEDVYVMMALAEIGKLRSNTGDYDLIINYIKLAKEESEKV